MPGKSWFSAPLVARSLLAPLIAPLLSLIAFSQPPQPIFPVTTLDSTITGPNFATGDFNGDGQPDIASITSTMAIQVLLTPVGSTTPITTTTAPLNCRSINSFAAADINKDHILDLVLNCAGNSIAILLGNGDGTFQAPTFFAISGLQSFAPPIDLNADGFPDIVANTGANIAVLLNHGGLLSSPVLYINSVLAPTPVTGDFNGDGKQDVLLWAINTEGPLLPNSSPFAVLYSNGDGTFQSPQNVSLPKNISAGSFIVSDLNNDGITDLAYVSNDTTTAKGYTVQVLLGNSSGSFTTGSSTSIALLGGLSSIVHPALVAFKSSTSNNATDLAVLGDGTTILIGDGKGGFTTGQSFLFTGQVVPQADSSGKTSLIVSTSSGAAILAGNGDGTFQGPPAIPIGSTGYIAADVNGDGIADILSTDSNHTLLISIGRGNGTFSNVIQNPALTADLLATGDFNKDGIIDLAGITAGNPEEDFSGGNIIPAKDAMLYLYAGNGVGAFQPNTNGADLGVIGAQSAVVGDFNADGNLDLVISYTNLHFSGLVFLPGKGDGTFGTAVPFAQQLSGGTGQVIAADLNKDSKLDLLWNGVAFLGNGDGTFTQIPSNFTVQSPVAVADLNGDGIPDLVAGANLYAGNGDGTFQTTPFFTAPGTISAAIGDVNADGHPDLLVEQNNSVTVLLGQGAGNFVADPTSYYTGGLGPLALGRANNQAPQLPGDNTLDLLVATSGLASSLLNQLNPVPTTPAALPSKTALTVSANSAAPGQQLTFTATVTGLNPTGNVTFTSGSTTLGIAPVANGIASLPLSFPTTGTYPVTATYPGDTNNLPSSSTAVSIAVAPVATKTTLSVSSGSANLNQSLSLTATITGLNPTGNVTFTSATATLGTAAATNGTATLQFAFTAPGTYSVTANYAGDIANLTSTSNTVTILVTAPDYSVTASPSSATVTAGQSATTTLTVTPVGGYNGTIKFSCGTLPSGASCTFAPASLTPASGASSTSTLTITTTATTTASLRNEISGSLQGIAWAGLVFLVLSPRRMRGLNRRLTRATLLTFLLAAGLISFSGCSSSSPKAPVTVPGTPAGVQTISVMVADSGSTSHSINFQLTVQ
jgi:hypothetical protein